MRTPDDRDWPRERESEGSANRNALLRREYSLEFTVLNRASGPLRSAQVRTLCAHCEHTVRTLCAHTHTVRTLCAHTRARCAHCVCDEHTQWRANAARTPGGTRTARRDCASETAQAEQCYAQRCTVQCTALHSAVRTVLHSAAQCCTVLHSAAQCCTASALHSAAQCCTVHGAA